jgi:hypothetical protein
VRIFREEIYLQIQDENRTAASHVEADLSKVAKAWKEGKSDTLNRLKVDKKRPKRSEEGA